MALGFLDLNEDYQREIIKKVLLDSEAKTVRIVDATPNRSVMTTDRPAVTNALTLVNKAIHTLFEDEVRRYQVNELRSLGWSLGASLTKWNLLCFKDVRYLRLILDFTKPRSIMDRGIFVTDVRQSLLEVAQLLTQHFQGLIDLQLVVQVNAVTLDGTIKIKDELRAFVLHRFAHEIDGLRKLKAVHAWYATMNDSKLLNLPHSTKKKMANEWRHDLKVFSMGFNATAWQGQHQMADSIGLRHIAQVP